MTEQQAINAIHALPRMAKGGASLTRMQALLDQLGNPEKELKCIHIAGTNGKGTLAAMTSSILTHAGYKTGMTISPYVLNFRERFQIDGKMIPPRTLASLTARVLDAADAVEAQGGEGPVEFEAVTAIAFLWFAREKCDFVVLETGLGGRYDATNVIPSPLVAAITRIGLDHTEILGETLPEIAAEKAGIIKEGCAVVCYPEQPEEAMGPLFNAAAEAHTSIITPDLEDLQFLKCRPLENYIDYGGYRVKLPFPGKHQANHAAMAVEIALTLWREYGYEIPDDAIEAGLREASMPARIEVLRRHPLLLLDGCHNPDGTAALAATLADAGYDGNLVGVIGMLEDKNCEKMLENLAPCFDKAFTVTPDSPRAMTAEELQERAKFHMDAEAAKSVPAAIKQAIAWADENNLAGVVVCGSLYLAAEARPYLLKEAQK
ncbi:MAG: bifunctional folylpolyglutamate synthase/dihydrofolate synthase [Oscillospiraceae bacterium]|nr:bifunctional folylpolyglutamate synthase/dihydrofolate synthase [Oscillospiraceae bacterium]